MITFEKAYSWLNKFTPSGLDDPAIQLIKQLNTALIGEDNSEVWQLIGRLMAISESYGDGQDIADIQLECARAKYILGNCEGAIKILRDIKGNYYPDSHKVGVVQWMLGYMLWQIPDQKNKAILAWKESIEFFSSIPRDKRFLDLDGIDWYNKRITEMRESLRLAIEINGVKFPDDSGSTVLDNNVDYGVLHIPLAESIPARVLADIVSVLDDSYFAHLWLSLAEKSKDDMPFPDVYTPNPKETLYILGLEIGTPNWIEIIGQPEQLLTILAIISGALGILSSVGPKKILEYKKLKLEIEGEKLENRLKKLDLEEREREREKIKQDEIRKLIKENQFLKTYHIEKLDNREIETNLAEKALHLEKVGRISKSALQHKIQTQESIKTKIRYAFPRYVGEPSLIIVESISHKIESIDSN